MSSSSSSTIPPSPRHVLQQSIALSDALNGAFTFASISAAHFSAITAPLPLALPARTAAPSSSICTAYASVPSKESNMPRRYNLRSSTSSQSEKENCQMTHPTDENVQSDRNRSHQRHQMPESASQVLANATRNSRLVRLMRKSTSNNVATTSSTANPPTSLSSLMFNSLDVRDAEGVEDNGSPGTADSLDVPPLPPLLASTPSKTPSSANLLRSCLESSTRRMDGGGYNFSDAGGWLTARRCGTSSESKGSTSSGSTINIGSSLSANFGSTNLTNDSVIVLDDDDDDADDDVGTQEVFVFTGSERANESENDSVIIMSPPMPGQNEADDAELLDQSENLDSSICVTRHKVKRVCPITKQPFIFPKKNRKCGHVYEAEAIRAMIVARWNKGKLTAHCPVAGCQQLVFYSDMENVQ